MLGVASALERAEKDLEAAKGKKGCSVDFTSELYANICSRETRSWEVQKTI